VRVWFCQGDAFWRQREATLEKYAQDLYQRHLSGQYTHEELQQAFQALPGEWPDCPRADYLALMQKELALLRCRLQANCSHSVTDAMRQRLDLPRLMPCFALAVVIRFSLFCGYSEEMATRLDCLDCGNLGYRNTVL